MFYTIPLIGIILRAYIAIVFKVLYIYRIAPWLLCKRHYFTASSSYYGIIYVE